MKMEERKYWVKSNYKFNIDSMITHVWCLQYRIDDGEFDHVYLMGKKMDWQALEDFKQELYDLLYVCDRKVTGKEYGRIKAVSDERNMIRYATCINNGMSESDAGYAFFD